VLDPELVATFRAVATRTDIAHRVLTILESDRYHVDPTDVDLVSVAEQAGTNRDPSPCSSLRP
jgi:hypothetical protein